MEETKEVEKNEKQTKQDKNKFTIAGFSIYRILAYFIIYSVIGYVIETLYGMATKGVWESRQSFLYGPFCSIYGVGATIMIMVLQRINKNNNSLFIGGFILGSIVEYSISWFGETFMHVKWWDYSGMPLNINGRICVFFSLFWGFLAIYLMSYANPKIDKLINWLKGKMSLKLAKAITIAVTVILFIDCMVSVYALEMFRIRKVHENNLNVAEKEYINRRYEEIYGNEELSNIIYKYFSDEKIIKTFPNLKTQDIDGNIIYYDCYVGDIKPYYYKFKSTLRGDLEKIIRNEYRDKAQ